MQTKKIVALAVSFLMLAVAGIAIIQINPETDAAAGEAGYMNVYVKTTGNWSMQTVSAVNGCEALKMTYGYNQYTDDIDDEFYKQYYDEDEETWYTNINSSYGEITTYMGLTEATVEGVLNTWHILVYVPVYDETEEEYFYEWTAPSVSLGYYKPFADYASVMYTYATADIAVWYGADSQESAVKAALESYSQNTIRALTVTSTITGCAFEHLFYIKNKTAETMTVNSGTTVKTYDPSTGIYTSNVTLTASMINNGVYIVGYGSDAETALINAVGANVSFGASSPVPGYYAYGWFDTMFGNGTVQTAGQDTPKNYYDDHYRYWSTYTVYDDTNYVYVWANFVAGAYSALTNAPLVDGTLAFIYEAS